MNLDNQSSSPADALSSLRRYLRLGLSLSAILVFGLGGWAVATEISGAVIANGHLVVDSSVKKVQHPTGGVIGEINVSEGAAVKAGDVLVRLDPTVTRANLSIVSNSLDQLTARRARLEAERDGATQLAVPDRLASRAEEPDVRSLIASETTLLELRRAAREGQKAQLLERVQQLQQETNGQAIQRDAKQQEIALVDAELTGVRDLHRQNLVPISRVNLLEREGVRMRGEIGALIAAIGSAGAKVSETRLQIIQIDQQFRSEVSSELREVEDRTAELVEREISARDLLKRVDIRAPQDGIVHDLSVFTVGGVVAPGDTLMSIVPSHDELAVDVRVSPRDIAHVQPGQDVRLRILALNQRTTPEIPGLVDRVAADLTTEAKTGASFYTVRIRIPQEALETIDKAALVPGMPVESFLTTAQRSVMSYLTSPLRDQLSRAFREN